MVPIVLQISARADMGGGPRHIQYLLEEIKDEVACFIACPDDKPFIDVYKLLIGENAIQLIPHRKVELRAVVSLLKFIKKHHITIIHCHGKGASVYGKLLKIFRPGLKIVYTPHGIHISEYSSISRTIYKLYERLTEFLFNKVLYVSESEQQFASKNRLFTTVNYQVIPNGVPISDKHYSYTDVRVLKQNILNDPDKKVVLTLSRFDYQKNMGEALKIAQLLPQYNFLWVGTGESVLKLEDDIKELGLKNVYMVGVQSDVRPYIKISDMYLSTSRWEGMPLALLEAMADGLVCVATNVTGNKDLVDVNTGYLYELGDVNDAAIKIKRAFGSSALQRDDIVRVFKGKYAVNIMAKKILNVYNEFQK